MSVLLPQPFLKNPITIVTDQNSHKLIKYISETTVTLTQWRPRISIHVFDEIHTSVPIQHAPDALSALPISSEDETYPDYDFSVPVIDKLEEAEQDFLS